MKVVIIGGGIAGLTLGIFLREKNYEVSVNERYNGIPNRGHAFLMHGDGLSLLTDRSNSLGGKLKSKKIEAYSFNRPDGKEIKHLALNSWHCLKRVDVISYLYSQLPKEILHEGRIFSHFIYKDKKIIGAAFINGDIEYGDIFVGADGANSRVRDLIFGKVDFTPVQVKEVVGVCTNETVAANHPSVFTKYQNKNNGLAFGLIPASGNDFVWFLQYDPALSDINDSTPDELKAFCHKLLRKYPPIVNEIIQSNDFNTTYVWNTRDFDLMPSFHKKNVVLIGDAAHQALPFTSAGTTNAVVDAKTLMECLEKFDNYEAAFKEYYNLRNADVAKHIQMGRNLKKIFLNPQGHDDDDLPVPLIAQKEDTELIAKNKKIQVTYFTDPICSTCWIIQPQVRKLLLEYDKYVNIEYRMGGLLPSWEDYNKGKIQKPADAAQLWEEVCAIHDMPLDGDVWIEDPLTSSFPPSIAFKAAQMQDKEKAILFLRRIKEMVFVEKKNIIKWEFLKKAAFEVGLDTARLLKDFDGKAKEYFRDDLVLSTEMGVTGFPTFFFTNGLGKQMVLKGYHPYEKFEEIINMLMDDVKKEPINTDPKSLFTHFPAMTEKEFAFMCGISRDEANLRLQNLFKEGSINKFESKNGVIWMNNFES